MSVLLTDRAAALAAVRENGMALEFATPELRGDREVVLAAVAQAGGALRSAADALRADREVVRRAAGRNAAALGFAAPALLADRDLVREVARREPAALGFAAEELRGDPELVREVVARSWSAFQYATEALRGDRGFVLPAVRSDGRLLRYCSEALRGDKDVTIAAVRSYGLALECCTPAIRCEYEIVLAAVNQDGLALQFADPALRDDHRIVVDAIVRSPQAMRYASIRLRQDPEAMAAQGLTGYAPPKNEKAPPPEVFESPCGFVEYRRPRVACWPVVLSVPHGGQLRPNEIPDRTTGCVEPDWQTEELANETWNEFGKGRIAAPAMVFLRLHRSKLDGNRGRHSCCEGQNYQALEAWDVYHRWIAEALKACVDKFGFALLLDLHGQSHRRLVTELGYRVGVDDLLLFDGVLDMSTRPCSVDALLRKDHPWAGRRPGGLSALLRGPKSLGAFLETRGFKCTPSPAMPEPVKAIPLYKLREEQKEAEAHADTAAKCGPPTGDAAAVTYFSAGYSVIRYGSPGEVPSQAAPLTKQDQATWATHVAAIQLETSWLGVRDGILQQRTFGEALAWASEQLLEAWLGWTMPADERG